jgi:competence protein ComEC
MAVETSIMKTWNGILVLMLWWCSVWAAPLTPVANDDWGLKIVLFDVGQGDGALLLTPNGDAAVIDMGKTRRHGQKMVTYLRSPTKNGVKKIDALKYLFASHYDKDHIGGVLAFAGVITPKAAYDQGPSRIRQAKVEIPFTTYSHYVRYVGDSNGDGLAGAGEPRFVRHRAEYGEDFKMSSTGEVLIRIVSVRGDTKGSGHDLSRLDPAAPDFIKDENPGSIIQLVTLGNFEYLTTGDATSDDWKSEPDTEEALIKASAIPGGHNIDVLKVSHHGSDTSSGKLFVASVRPEVAIISSDLTTHKLPKLTTIKVLEENKAVVLVTGRATTRTGKYHQSQNSFDDNYVPQQTTDRLGTITILVARDGSKYTVTSEKNAQFSRTFSSSD